MHMYVVHMLLSVRIMMERIFMIDVNFQYFQDTIFLYLLQNCFSKSVL
jgi:hypothetical protein